MPAPYGRVFNGTSWAAATTPQFSNQHVLYNQAALVGYLPYTSYDAGTQIFGGELLGYGVTQQVSFGQLPLPDGTTGLDLYAVVSYESTSVVVVGQARSTDGGTLESVLILARATGDHTRLTLPPLGTLSLGPAAFVAGRLWVQTSEQVIDDNVVRVYSREVATETEWTLVSTITYEDATQGIATGFRAIDTGIFWGVNHAEIAGSVSELYFFDLDENRSLVSSESITNLVAADNDGRVWVSNASGELLRSDDSGSSFSKIADAIPDPVGGESPKWSGYGMKWSDGGWYFQGGNLWTIGGALVRVVRDLNGVVTQADSSTLNSPGGLAGVAF